MALVRDERTTVGVIQFDPQPAPSLGTGFGYANGALWFDSGTNAFSAMINGVATPVASIASVAALPATCTPGVTSPVQLSVSPFGVYNCTATNVWTIIGTVAGGSFGASPSSGYTFTSTPITASPFGGNLLIGANTQISGAGTYTAGAGYTLGPVDNATMAMEYQLAAGSATSFSAPFTYSSASAWAGTIAAFACSPTCAWIQSKQSTGSATAAFTSNVGAGHLLVAAIRYNASTDGGPVSSVTDTLGNTWVSGGLRAPVSYAKGAGGPQYLEFWYALSSLSAGANTVTEHGLSGTTNTAIGLMEFSGTGAIVDYNFNGSATAVTSMSGATTNSQFLYQAINNTTGVVDFSGRDHAVVFRNAANNRASVGGQLYHKAGIYNGQTSIQEVNNSQTNWYVFSLPPNGGSNVYWDLVGETGTQASGNNQFGTIFQALPSVYAGPAPSGGTLSVLWQRPAASAVQNSVLFRNMACRIPDNQRSPTNCFDSFQATYSYHINTIADTAVSYTDQLCSGITPAVANMTGFRTNQATTNESYFENTWAIGWNAPYNLLSNHVYGVNMHALCNQNAGNFAVATSIYGSEFHHFQDIHNINGPILNCANQGTRIIFDGTITEVATSGSFSRSTNATETNPGFCVGRADNTTGTANGAVFNPSPFFASGSGANFRSNESDRLLQPGLVTSNFTSAATTGTTKQTLATYTFAYVTNASGPNLGPFQNNPGATFRIKAWGITAANANSKVFEIDFGGTAIATITSTASSGSVKCEAEIIVSSVANTQEVLGYCDDGATRTVTRTAPGITGNAAIVTNIAATTATSSGDFTFKGLTIEYVGGN